jgi:hypothetical protein
LESLCATLTELDEHGYYFVERAEDNYNGHEVSVFRRLYLAFGTVLVMLEESDVLLFFSLDVAHCKSVFGHSVMACVGLGANAALIPVSLAVVYGETAENVAWFMDHTLSMPSLKDQMKKNRASPKCIIISDQGKALLANEVSELFEQYGVRRRSCGEHLPTTIAQNKRGKKGTIKGSLKNVASDVRRVATALTREDAERRVDAIKNPTVQEYIRDRVEQISPYKCLEEGLASGGRTTSQAAESFFNMILPFRRSGLVSGILWLCGRFQERVRADVTVARDHRQVRQVERFDAARLLVVHVAQVGMHA